MRRISLSKPFINQEIRDAVLGVLDSGRFILGPQCQEFERELARMAGRKHAVLASSWTAGVYLLHLAMGLQPGDEVLAPSHTAFPSIEPMLHCGAKPAFVDIDDTFCLDPKLLRAPSRRARWESCPCIYTAIRRISIARWKSRGAINFG